MNQASRRIFVFSVAACMAASLFFAARSLHCADPSSPWSIALPAGANQFDDIDLRDAENRPIHCPSLKRQTQKLFSDGLHALLMANLTPAKRAVEEILRQNWDGALAVSRAAARRAAALVVAAESRVRAISDHAAFRVWRIDRADSVTACPAKTGLTRLALKILETTCLLR